MPELIQPRLLKGFRDYPPELMIPRERLLETARRVYRSYGFAPIDTPVLEFTEILLGKGGAETDRQLFRFMHHDDDVALRFDLTVPLARFAAMHVPKLGTPFKRYHLGPVWRGERPQKGRYREFWQCDFDTIGTLSNAADCETALVIHDLLVGLGIERFEIRVNNRMVLNGFLKVRGLEDKAVPILRALDKLPKIGREEVFLEMKREAGVERGDADAILWFAEMPEATEPERNQQVLVLLKQYFTGNFADEKAAEGIQRLQELLKVSKEAGIPEDRIKIDLSITRGLDYYTGMIYETFLTDLPGIGSICSGGRYDNLASLYTKQVLPGVGASLGLDRLLAAMEELGMLPKVATPAPVFVVQFSADRLGDYQRVARVLRAANIGAEVYPDAKKIGQQLAYADKRGFRLALIAGPDDFAKGVWIIKDLTLAADQDKVFVAEAELLAEVAKRLR